MDIVRRYLYSNLYIFLPSVLILVLVPLLYIVFEQHWIRVSTDTFSACDFSSGGGSQNLCDNDILFSTFLSALCTATPLAFLLTAGLNRLLQIHWLSPLLGIALFFSVPLVFLLLYTVFTAGIYGELRGKINNGILTIGIPVCLILVAAVSYVNYRKFSEQESNAPEQQ
jgi:hypothetical protein